MFAGGPRPPGVAPGGIEGLRLRLFGTGRPTSKVTSRAHPPHSYQPQEGNTLRKKLLVLPLLAVASVIGGLFVTAGPAQATASDGIQIAEFPYVFETDDWLDVTLDSCPTPAPSFIVVNIGNGTTDDVAHLETVAQTIRACGIKVLGYVNVWTGSAMRSAYDVGLDASRYINPYNPERTIGGQMVDGIMFDGYPRDCGPLETPTNNTSNDADYVLRGDAITDNVHDQFALWSYGTPTVAANVGTAVRGCHPGWENLSGHPMPDLWGTLEGDYSTVQSSWAGGNIITGGTWGTTYEEGNNYYPNAFFHIVYGASTMAQTEAAIDKADERGAAHVFVTDDSGANPYDTEPTFEAGARTYASNGPMGMRYDYLSDFIPGTYTGTDYVGVVRQDRQGASSTPRNGLDILYSTVNAACSSGTWGTPNTVKDSNGGADDPASGKVTCAKALMQDGTGRDPFAVVCGGPRETTAQDPTNDEADCQDPDGSGTYTVNATYSTILRAEFFKDDDQTEQMLIFARDQVLGTGVDAEDSVLDAQCVIGRYDWALPRAFSTCP